MKPEAARARALAAWLLPLGAGAALRLWNLDRQILLDDEMHTVGTALYVPIRDILSSWKSEDPCLPLAALYRALLEGGLRFSEMTFRAPVIVASLAAILLLPWLARPLYGRRAALFFAWLVALSPVLAIYGGMVRPYGVVALLAPAGTLVVLRWRASGRLAWGLAWAVLAALCLWFHLATAPLVVVPFGLLALESVRARMRRGAPSGALPTLRELAVAAAVATLLIAAFMVPLWQSLRELYAAKSGVARFSFELVPPIARLQAGTAVGDGAVAATVMFWSLAVLGGAVLARGRPALVTYPVAVTLALWVGLATLAPIGLLNPIIFNRYLIGTLPLVLLLVATGLDAAVGRLEATIRGSAAGDRGERSSFGANAAAVVVLVLLVASGPYGDATFRRSSFQHNKDFIRFDQPRGKLSADAVPSFYREVRATGEEGSIIEFPFRGGWSATRSHYVYQGVHRAPVIAAEPFGWPCDERLRLRNHVCSAPAMLLRSPARYLVVHRDPLTEESAIVGGDDSGNRYNPQEWVQFAETAGRVTRGLRRRFGPPLYRDDRMTVWDLEEVRRRTKEGPRAAH